MEDLPVELFEAQQTLMVLAERAPLQEQVALRALLAPFAEASAALESDESSALMHMCIATADGRTDHWGRPDATLRTRLAVGLPMQAAAAETPSLVLYDKHSSAVFCSAPGEAVESVRDVASFICAHREGRLAPHPLLDLATHGEAWGLDHLPSLVCVFYTAGAPRDLGQTTSSRPTLQPPLRMQPLHPSPTRNSRCSEA